MPIFCFFRVWLGVFDKGCAKIHIDTPSSQVFIIVWENYWAKIL